MNYRRFKYSPIFTIRGEYSAGGGLDDSDIIGSIENCIAVNVAKLTPQVMRKDARGMTIKDDYLARLLSLRWAPELSAYDALYKMAATLVRKSNAFAAVMYNEDFTKVKQIVPLRCLPSGSMKTTTEIFYSGSLGTTTGKRMYCHIRA